MRAEFYKKQIHTLIGMVKNGKGDEADDMSVLSAAALLDQPHLEREHAMFRRLPLLIAHSRELSENGDYIVRELAGRSWLLVRGKDGKARAFYNYCQHRGTKLEQSSQGCKKRFSCPYHAWTYDTEGQLLGVPRADLFPGLDKKSKSLKQADLQEAFGFLWLTQEVDKAQAIDEYLGGLGAEFEALNLGKHHVYFDKTRTLDANWKLPIYAFLESYHISTLHRDSIAEFFVENVAHSERHGPHIRSFVPRKKVLELQDQELADCHIADYITPTNIVFPNVCMIAHPTSYTIISLFPGETPGTASWRHMLLVPEQPKTEAQRAHFDKTVKVLDGMTYEKEDFWVSEQLQQGINAGAIDELVLAKNEHMIKVFSDTVDEYCELSNQA